MKLLLRGLAVIAFLIFSYNVTAQQFPPTEKEVKELLCAKKWKVKEMIRGEDKVDVSRIGVSIVLDLNEDYTFEMVASGAITKGTWKIDFASKQIFLSENGQPHSILSNIREGEFFASPGKKIQGATTNFGMLYVPAE